MGARFARMVRNFNLENRVHQEISREKPSAAPRHAGSLPPSSGSCEGECLEPSLTCVTVTSGVMQGGLLTLRRKLLIKFLIKPHEHLCGLAADSINQKNDPLLKLLRSVYVESKDTAPAAEASKEVKVDKQVERRPLRFSLKGDFYGLMDLTDVPKGKLTITEALKALGSHQQQPQTWTAEKIAQEYSLELKDTKSLLEFFIPFQVHIIPPKNENAKQIKAS
uniref:NADH dehydrogenase [ubiquinone] 1 alpha subcomplex assembly factor 4 n=1 Tax=Monopterus albus TaxID=43700 RepID=A0A3Q3JGJ1_MONAL